MPRSAIQIGTLLSLLVGLAVARQAVRHPVHIQPRPQSSSGCTINVNTELGTPSPLPLQQQELNILSPDVNGEIRIESGKSVYLFCSENFELAEVADAKLLAVRCLHDQSVEVSNSALGTSAASTVISLASLSCTAHIKTGIAIDSTAGNLTFARIGFTLPTDRFIGLIDLAYDSADERSLYAHHQLGVGIAHAQLPDARIAFRKDGLFTGDLHLYERESQRVIICDALLHLSAAQCDQYFGNAQKYLARGHLAPAGDFEYRAEQRSTYSLANVAPQWQSINNGNWKALETAVRKLAVKRPSTGGGRLDIVTGTLGTLRLPNGAGKLTSVSLDGSGRIPVPEWFYKVVVDRTSGDGVAFVVSNNPTLSVREVRDAAAPLQLCADVSEQLTWTDMLGKSTLRLDKGYVYACEVADFVRNAKVALPAFLQAGEFGLLV